MITAKITLKSDKKIIKKKLMEEKETNLESNMKRNSNDGQTYRPSTTFSRNVTLNIKWISKSHFLWQKKTIITMKK